MTKKSTKAKTTTKAAKVTKVAAKKAKPSKKVVVAKSFEIGKEKLPFMSFKFTEQTVYWLILLALIFGLSLWVLKIQLDILTIVDSI